MGSVRAVLSAYTQPEPSTWLKVTKDIQRVARWPSGEWRSGRCRLDTSRPLDAQDYRWRSCAIRAPKSGVPRPVAGL